MKRVVYRLTLDNGGKEGNSLSKKRKMAPTAKPPQNILGVVSTFGNSLSALKDDLKVAFGDYPEAAQDEKEDWYDEIAKIKDFEYEMDMQAFLN